MGSFFLDLFSFMVPATYNLVLLLLSAHFYNYSLQLSKTIKFPFLPVELKINLIQTLTLQTNSSRYLQLFNLFIFVPRMNMHQISNIF